MKTKDPFISVSLFLILVNFLFIGNYTTLGQTTNRIIINQSFEDGTPSEALMPMADVPGWSTTDSPAVIEVWGHNRVLSGVTYPAKHGSFFVEMNAYNSAFLYQTVYLVNGETIDWEYSHMNRTNGTSEIAKLAIYPETGSVTTTNMLATLNTSTVTAAATWVDRSGAWVSTLATGVYRIGFVSTNAGSSGNLLDDISIGLTPFIEITESSYSFNEGDGQQPELYINGRVTGNPTVTISVTGGTATNGDDFSLGTLTITVPAGDYGLGDKIAIPITTLSDVVFNEGIETINFSITAMDSPLFAADANADGNNNQTSVIQIYENISPGGVGTNLDLWLRGDQSGTMIEDQAVPTWTDQSGAGNDATSSTGSVYKGGVFNYQPALYNDGSNSDKAYTVSSFTNQDIYVVADYTPGPNFAYYDGLITDGASSNFYLFLANSGSTSWYLGDNGRAGNRFINGSSSTNFGPIANQHLVTGDFDASSTNVLYIGTDRGSTSRTWQGNIAEVVVYNAGSSAIEKQKIESYLALKYGMTLATNYLNSSGTTIYDVTGYGDDVIGLIRDDASGLLQKQSHAIDDSSRIYLSSLVSTNSSNTGTFTQESSLMMGHNGEANSNDMVNGSGLTEIPTGLGITDRIEREWKITNTNFNETFTLDINLNTPITNVNDIRVLQDDDGDFSDATIAGVTITLSNAGFGGVLTITGLTVSSNTTKYITIASLNTINTLPVELVKFTAELKDRIVTLNWETKSEINNDYFMVERSKDGVNWENLNKVDGAGSSIVTLNYESFDKNPFVETSYYRLKQVDFDGAFNYSSIRAVNFIKTAELEMFPNPAKDILNIVSGSAIETSEIRLFSNLGVNLMNRNRLSINDENKCTIDIYDLPTGMYTILVNGKSFSFVKE